MYDEYVLCYSDAPKGVSVIPNTNDWTMGENVILTCNVTRSKPEVGCYKWFKDQHELEGKVNSKLTLLNIQPSQKGNYYCQAVNSVNATSSNQIDIKVMCKY